MIDLQNECQSFFKNKDRFTKMMNDSFSKRGSIYKNVNIFTKKMMIYKNDDLQKGKIGFGGVTIWKRSLFRGDN